LNLKVCLRNKTVSIINYLHRFYLWSVHLKGGVKIQHISTLSTHPLGTTVVIHLPSFLVPPSTNSLADLHHRSRFRAHPVNSPHSFGGRCRIKSFSGPALTRTGDLPSEIFCARMVCRYASALLSHTPVVGLLVISPSRFGATVDAQQNVTVSINLSDFWLLSHRRA
jgi:hypothetical protein